MRQHEFDTYGEYEEAQRSLTLRKLEKGNSRCFFSPVVAEAIAEHHPSPVLRGLCHGVRLGDELGMFETAMGGKWIGTEIVKELCDEVRVFKKDFSEVRTGWIGEFDVIYSNSLDHARDPYKTLKAWISCLSPSGRLYVEWSVWHGRLGRRENFADCFAADMDEYQELIASAGRFLRRFNVRCRGHGKGGRDYRCVIFVVH